MNFRRQTVGTFFFHEVEFQIQWGARSNRTHINIFVRREVQHKPSLNQNTLGLYLRTLS